MTLNRHNHHSQASPSPHTSTRRDKPPQGLDANQGGKQSEVSRSTCLVACRYWRIGIVLVRYGISFRGTVSGDCWPPLHEKKGKCIPKQVVMCSQGVSVVVDSGWGLDGCLRFLSSMGVTDGKVWFVQGLPPVHLMVSCCFPFLCFYTPFFFILLMFFSNP